MSFIIREARANDAEAVVELIADLGHSMTVDDVRERIETLQQAGCVQLVASTDDGVIGLCGLHIMTAIHRPKPVGRITILEVTQEFRGKGVGRALIAAAEERLRQAGCGLVEVTSNGRLVEAHGFYLSVGFEHTSKRFAKQL
jgi:predicted N-acetyltransferase YhbS